MSSIPIQKEAYSFEKKKKLAARISDMRDKDTLRKIRDIIFTENPEISAKKSSGGYLMYFQNYTTNTYIKIEKYLNKLDAEKLEKITRSITENSDHPMMSSEADIHSSNVDYTISRSKLKYSNKERRLIKRTQYEKCVNEKIPNIMTSDNNNVSNGIITETNEVDSDKKSESESSDKHTNKIENSSKNNKNIGKNNTGKNVQTIFSKSM
jgi:hypothetical protein